jgi:hypothetical protein
MMNFFKPLLALTLWMLFVAALCDAIPGKTLTLPLDCRKSGIQAGVPVRRNSDGRVTQVDVCGAADSPVDTFRDIPYEAHCEDYDNGRICY